MTHTDKIIEALLVLCPPPVGDQQPPHNFVIRANNEVMELLKDSDNPFAGYLISCMCETKEEAEAAYNDWLSRKLKSSIS